MEKKLSQRLVSIMLGICMVFMCLPQRTLPRIDAAATVYGIVVKSKYVTSNNADDILGDGHLRYDASENILYMKGYIDCSSTNARGSTVSYGISNESEYGLTLVVEEDCIINGYISCEVNTTITGSGKLQVKSPFSSKEGSSGSIVVLGNLATLTIKNADIDVNFDIYGNITTTALNIINSNVTVGQTIWGFREGITLDNCYVKSPEKSRVDGSSIMKSNEDDPLVIVPGEDPDPYIPPVSAGIRIGWTDVDSENADDVLGDGVFSYNADTKTLTVNGDYDDKIHNVSCDGLTIDIVSDSTITNITGSTNTTITGKGIVGTIFARSGAAITIDNADIEVLGSIYGDYTGEKLDIICSDVWVNGKLYDLTGGITLEDTKFIPKEGQNLTSSGVYDDNGSTIANLQFRAKGDPLGIFVGDTEVDTKNASDVLRNGKVVYSPISNCLYLYGDIDLSGCKSPTIRNESCEGLTITTDDSKTSKTSFSIKGGLEIMAETFIDPGYRHMDYTITPVNGNAITVSNGALLTINARSLNAQGAIAGSGTGEQLKIQYCDLDCVGDGESSAINGFNNGIVLENCKITEPVGADVNGSAVLTADGEPVEKLHIDRQIRYGVMVNLVQLTEDNLDSIGELFSKSDDAMEKYLNGEEFVSFDPETNTLTLKDVDLSGDVLIFTDVDLNIEGDVKFGKIMSFMGENEFRITGPGTLTSTSSSAYLYSCFNASLSISETTINSDIKAITDGSLTIFSSNINAPNGISEFKGGITLKECSVESPKKAIIGTSIYESDGSTIASNVVIGGSHIHTDKMTLVEAVEPTCVTAGNIAYYKCTCGRYFTDENAENEITLSETVIPATGHSLALVEGVEATCEENGCLQHYSCENCGVFFYDENGESPVIFPTDLIIYAKGHDYGSPVYRWNSDLSQATAYCVCSNDSEHIISETVDTTYTDNNGERTYLADFEYYRFSDQSIKVEIPEIPETVLVGDANSDGNVDVLDAILIAHYANGWPDTELDTDAADIDRDGEINVLDAMLITRYVNGWDGYNKYIIQVLR